MAITRRELAAVLAATAAPQMQGAPQPQDEETQSAHDALKDNAQQLDKIPLPMATEPVCHFKAQP